MRISDWSSDVCSSDLLVHIAAQDRRDIGIDHGGIAAADELDQRRDLVAGRDLGEAERLGQVCNLCLLGGIAVAVHEQDGDRTEDRKSVVSGKRVSVRVDFGGRRNNKKKNKKRT